MDLVVCDDIMINYLSFLKELRNYLIYLTSTHNGNLTYIWPIFKIMYNSAKKKYMKKKQPKKSVLRMVTAEVP
jgi:hypothetical protein